MNKLVSWSGEDEAVAATNNDATECKRGAVELGYWADPYVRLFARRAERRAPEINRGYYARVRAVEIFIHQFLERCDSKCQIINLGCGFDTLFWRLRDATQAVGNFIELDFPSVTARKCQIIKRHKQLLEKISNEDGEVAMRVGELHADGYHLAGCDLRDAAGVRRALAACGARGEAPTLVLAECVLVYLREDAAARLLELLAQAFPRQLLVVYEQCSLDDKVAHHAAACGARGEAPTLVLAECVLVYLREDAAARLLELLAQAFPRQLLVVYEQCSLDDKVAHHAAACGARGEAPTLVLAECVLVYLREDAAARLLELLAQAFPRQLLVVYEQCSLDDKVAHHAAACGARGEAPTLVLAECVLVYLREDAAARLLELLAQAFPRQLLVVYEQCSLDDKVAHHAAACGARGEAPTLVLAECVLVYLREDAAARLLELLAQAFPRQLLVVYEQCSLDDKVAHHAAACGARGEAPTLVLAECVLVYLREDAAARLLELLAQAFPRQLLVVYEQCSLDDKFGEVMIRNLAARGCGAVGGRGRAGVEAAVARLRAAGYSAARGWDMDTVWRALGEDERARVEALEPLDERELLQQLHQHYALTVASQGDLFADIDLNA